MTKLDSVDNGNAFDFGKTSQEYAKFRDIYPAELFNKLYALGVGLKNENWLDLGTGTGVLPRAMYQYGANIIATDISDNQIAEARRLSEGMNITYKVCSADDSGYPDHYFHSITACQCFWYFDPVKTVPEIKRLLKPGGIFVKVYMGWLKEDPTADASKRLVKELNPNWTSSSPAVKDLTTHYFDNPVMDTFTADLPFTRETWHGRILACRGVLGSMDDDTLRAFIDKHLEYIKSLPEQFTVKHKIFITSYIIGK